MARLISTKGPVEKMALDNSKEPVFYYTHVGDILVEVDPENLNRNNMVQIFPRYDRFPGKTWPYLIRRNKNQPGYWVIRAASPGDNPEGPYPTRKVALAAIRMML